jgi:hypothetical protein
MFTATPVCSTTRSLLEIMNDTRLDDGGRALSADKQCAICSKTDRPGNPMLVAFSSPSYRKSEKVLAACVVWLMQNCGIMKKKLRRADTWPLAL